MDIICTRMHSPIGTLQLASTDLGILRIGLPHEDEINFVQGCLKDFGGDVFTDIECDTNSEAIKQLTSFFEGRLRKFSVRLDIRGTAFQKSVWEELTRIPYGQTRTYSQIAALIGMPKACRAVGAANSRNNIPIIIPCHRVVGTGGKLVGFTGGLDIKRSLLELEETQSKKDAPTDV